MFQSKLSKSLEPDFLPSEFVMGQDLKSRMVAASFTLFSAAVVENLASRHPTKLFTTFAIILELRPFPVSSISLNTCGEVLNFLKCGPGLKH